MRDLQETIELLRIRSRQHLQAAMSIDPCRIAGFWHCAGLADKLEHVHKMETQEKIT